MEDRPQASHAGGGAAGFGAAASKACPPGARRRPKAPSHVRSALRGSRASKARMAISRTRSFSASTPGRWRSWWRKGRSAWISVAVAGRGTAGRLPIAGPFARSAPDAASRLGDGRRRHRPRCPSCCAPAPYTPSRSWGRSRSTARHPGSAQGSAYPAPKPLASFRKASSPSLCPPAHAHEHTQACGSWPSHLILTRSAPIRSPGGTCAHAKRPTGRRRRERPVGRTVESPRDSDPPQDPRADVMPLKGPNQRLTRCL